MDNSFDHAWATPRVAAAALCSAGLILLGVALFAATDAVGMVMMVFAGVLLLAFGGYALIIRPRLAVTSRSAPELTIRTIGGIQTYQPAHIDRIRLLSLRRIGRRAGQLEIDLLPNGAGSRDDAKLVVFSRWDLGTDLISVADALQRAGFDVEDARH